MAQFRVIVKKTLVLNRMQYNEGSDISFEINNDCYQGKLEEINEYDHTITVYLAKPWVGRKVFNLADIDDTTHMWFD